MTVDQARRWIILASLIITGIQMVFLLLSPAILPLEYPENLDLLQIITPVFLGYLGSSAHFVFMNPPPAVAVNNQFLPLLVKGPIIIYASAMVAAFGTFWYTNRPGAPLGGNMTVDHLSTAMSLALGVLAATTAVIVSYLFVVNQPGLNSGEQAQVGSGGIDRPPAEGASHKVP